MKRYIIYDLISQTYFLGVNPKPCFGAINDGVITFDSQEEAEARITEEEELFGICKGRMLAVIKVIIG